MVGERELPGVSPYVQVEDSRKALGLLSTAWWGRPSEGLSVVGVTGTNGKSSVTWMVQQICQAAGQDSAVLGTLGVGAPPHLRPQPFTTPEAPEFQEELEKLRARGFLVAAVEVSSHGLELRRTYGTRFAVVVFTNLTQDHLDFHQTMDRYAAAKNLLFQEWERGADDVGTIAVVNADDPHLSAIVNGCTDTILTFGKGPEADVYPREVRLDPSGIKMSCRLPDDTIEIETTLLGSFQVENLLAATATALALEIDAPAIAKGLSDLEPIPGRMERIDRGQEFLVVVDYAHTPDALQRAIESLRPFTSGQIILVFGCGGDRDRSKRFRMGHIASLHADYIFLTDDNPRNEDPEKIRGEVLDGLLEGEATPREIPERDRAIASAIDRARPGDIVLITGKGHETVQIREDDVVPFDDRKVAAEKIAARLAQDARRRGGRA